MGTDFLQRDSFGGRLSRVGSGVSALGSAVPSEADMVRIVTLPPTLTCYPPEL